MSDDNNDEINDDNEWIRYGYTITDYMFFFFDYPINN